MLSVVIATHESERALLPTLAALVPGALAGLVREVIVADAGSRDATAEVADGAGCRILVATGVRGARLKAAANVALGPWLLFLRPGVVPDANWIDETRRFIEISERGGRRRSAAFRAASAEYRPLLVETFDLLRAALRAGPKPHQGLLIAKTTYDAVGGHREVEEPESELIGRLGRRSVVLLRSHMLMAQ